MAGLGRRPRAAGPGRQRQREVALLGQADHGDRLFDARHQAVADHRTFVQHEERTHALALQQAGDRGSTMAVALLVVSEGQVDRSPRLFTGFQEKLDRLQEAQDRELVVERSTPPDLALHLGTGKGLLVPAFRIGRHHIHVRRQDNGLELGVGAGPAIEQRVRLRHLALQSPCG